MLMYSLSHIISQILLKTLFGKVVFQIFAEVEMTVIWPPF